MNSQKNVLVLNAGSSSVKISLFHLDLSAPAKVLSRLAHALHDDRQEDTPHSALWHTEIDFPSPDLDSINWQDFLKQALVPLAKSQISELLQHNKIDIVGHRIVHGGDKYSQAVFITDEVKADIEKYIPLAPLHNKISLAQIKAIEKLLPNAQQIAVFDTAFHRTLPEAVSFYPLPYKWHEEYGIRRFGFHGINVEYCAQQAAHVLGQELSALSMIVCHLGSGCSLTAVENGKSINTTMGFTPLDGLMMGTRSGSIDPGILIYLLKNKTVTIDQLEFDLNKNSGLKGITQTSDMKAIIDHMEFQSEAGKLAKLAFEMFIDRLRASICAMRASLSRLDVLVFTAGIGENSALVRQAACAWLGFLGIKVDEEVNERLQIKKGPIFSDISSAKSEAAILVINAQEDWAIAEHHVRCLLANENS